MCHYPMMDSYSVSDLLEEQAKRVWRDSFEWIAMRTIDQGNLRSAYCAEVIETCKDLAYMFQNERREFEQALYEIRNSPIVE